MMSFSVERLCKAIIVLNIKIFFELHLKDTETNLFMNVQKDLNRLKVIYVSENVLSGGKILTFMLTGCEADYTLIIFLA